MITVVSDPHIGDYSYGKTDPVSGLNTRLLDFLYNLDQTIDFAIDKQSAYVIAGDIYRVKHPNSKIRKQFAARLKCLIKASVPTILMTGNHDMTTSSDGAHAMSEMEELSDVIDGLTIVSSPTVIRLGKEELYFLPFVNRGEQGLLTPQEFLAYQRKCIEDFNKQTKTSDAKYKLFFGHFGTDKSVVGNSFDLDMSSDENENKIELKLFEEGDWTKVYLGHIHKQQEFNDIVRHVGSLGRVDFSEESEQKGFYVFTKGTDKFIPVSDRRFVTFTLNLSDDYKDVLEKFHPTDLQDAIVKLKVNVKQTYFSAIRLDVIESYLRDNCWHFTSADINVVADDAIDENVDKITSIDMPDEALKKFVEKHAERFGDIKEKMIDRGIEILKQAKSM
jgi:exonuclease SbcD